MPATQEQRNGTISAINTDDTGVITDDISQERLEFFERGANAEFVVGDAVTYLRVTLPSGRVVVDRPVKRPN